MYEQSYEFTFEAAHDLAENVKGEDDHPYSRIHGHSFVVTLTLRTEKLCEEGWIIDFAKLREICDGLRDRLDHRLLNSIPGLERPTLENTAAWIFNAASKEAAALYKVEIARPTLNERVAYYAKN
ncbi:MAG: 6-carboxytetrahydropterin synthase [Parvularculaceae bacterium]